MSIGFSRPDIILPKEKDYHGFPERAVVFVIKTEFERVQHHRKTRNNHAD